jgi:hypothetical protein
LITILIIWFLFARLSHKAAIEYFYKIYCDEPTTYCSFSLKLDLLRVCSRKSLQGAVSFFFIFFFFFYSARLCSMGCNSSKQQDVANERERAPVSSSAKPVNKNARAVAPSTSAASPIRPSASRERARDRDDGPYELGKTPSDQHQREEDSFQELILRTQRNFIDIATQGSVGAMGSEDVLERQRDVSKFLDESEAPDDEAAPSLLRTPLGSAVAAADPVRVLQQACVTVEEEDALKMAAAAVSRGVLDFVFLVFFLMCFVLFLS